MNNLRSSVPIRAARLSISRQSGSINHGRCICVTVDDEISGTRVVEIYCTPAVLGEALTGLGARQCEYEPPSPHVGQRREHRTIRVDVTELTARCDKAPFAQRPTLAAKFAADTLDVDGWRTHVDDLTNHHRRTRQGERTYASVVQVRFVPATEEEHADCLQKNRQEDAEEHA